MGGIVKKPKIPKIVSQPQVKTENTETDTQAVQQDRVRRASLSDSLDPKQGRERTIRTSLRGVLRKDNGLQPQRKTLLGE